METPNVQIGAKVKFLEAELFGAFDHRAKAGKNPARDTVLVKQMNAGNQQTGISVLEIAESIAKSIKNISNPESTGKVKDEEIPAIKWPAGVEKIVGSLLVQINEVYLKIVKEGGSTNMEYALGIGIKLDPKKRDDLAAIPPFNLIEFEELFLKIWKTDNSAILDEMNIIDFDKIFPDSDKNNKSEGGKAGTDKTKT